MKEECTVSMERDKIEEREESMANRDKMHSGGSEKVEMSRVARRRYEEGADKG